VEKKSRFSYGFDRRISRGVTLAFGTSRLIFGELLYELRGLQDGCDGIRVQPKLGRLLHVNSSKSDIGCVSIQIMKWSIGLEGVKDDIRWPPSKRGFRSVVPHVAGPEDTKIAFRVSQFY
jgi:hypothetical protein